MSTPEQLQDLLMQLAPALDEYFNPGRAPGLKDGGRQHGFLIVAFEFGDPGKSLAFLSNATKETLVPALQELIRRMPKHGKTVSIPDPDKT